MLFVLANCTSINHTNIALEKKILVFSKTQAYRHASIAEGKLALLKLGRENNWIVDTSEDATAFYSQNLEKYKAIIFLNTSGNILDTIQKQAFQHFIRKGGGFVGIHAATDTEKKWPWYNDLVGAYFQGHPKPQNALYQVIDNTHPSVSFLPDTLTRFEEIYNFYSFKANLVKVVMTVDEKSYTGGKMGDNHPAAWYHNFDGGKAFYTAWGHHPETYTDPTFLQHITAAIKWTIN